MIKAVRTAERCAQLNSTASSSYLFSPKARALQPLDSEYDLDGGCALNYFGNDWSALNRRSSHSIARRLVRRIPLPHVDSPGMRAPNTSRRDLKKIARKLPQAVQLSTPIDAHFWRSAVPQLPFRSARSVRRDFRDRVSKQSGDQNVSS